MTKPGRKRIRKYEGHLTTIPVSDEIRELLSVKKEKDETYDDYLRRMLSI